MVEDIRVWVQFQNGREWFIDMVNFFEYFIVVKLFNVLQCIVFWVGSCNDKFVWWDKIDGIQGVVVVQVWWCVIESKWVFIGVCFG